MRIIAVVFGVLITLAGIVWALQGLGVIPGSFMSNNPPWIWIGGGTAPFGVALGALGLRFGPPAPSPGPAPPPTHGPRDGSISRRAIWEPRRPGRHPLGPRRPDP